MKQGIDYIGVGVVFYCHDEEGRVLMNKRSLSCKDEQGKWDIGGGGVELGETVDKVLEREIREEYGTRIVEKTFLGFRDVHREHNGKKTHWIALDFKVLVDPKLAKNNEPHKFDEVGWFLKERLPQPLHSQLPVFLEKYKLQL